MAAVSTTRVRLGFFTHSAVVRLAQDHGIFDKHGLSVDTDAVASSPAQFRSLEAGDYDLVLTSPDNVAAYRCTDANPLGRRLDARILLAVDGGLGLSLMTAGGIDSVAALRGRTIGVDVPQSGFAFALYDLLGAHGLHEHEDYTLVSLGSTPRRVGALLDGRCDATLLNAGHDIAAELAGAKRLARVGQRLHPYLGTVLAAAGPWLERNREVAAGFVQAWREAVAAVLEPSAADEVCALAEDVYQLDPASAAAMYAVLADPAEGLVPGGVVDEAGLRTVLDLRARYGGPDAGIELDAGFITRSGLLDPSAAAGAELRSAPRAAGRIADDQLHGKDRVLRGKGAAQ